MIAPDCWHIILSYVSFDKATWDSLSLVCKAMYNILDSLEFTYKATNLIRTIWKNKQYKYIVVDCKKYATDGCWILDLCKCSPEYLIIKNGHDLFIAQNDIPSSVKHLAIINCNIVNFITLEHVTHLNLYNVSSTKLISQRASSFGLLHTLVTKDSGSIFSNADLYIKGWSTNNGYLVPTKNKQCDIL